MIYENFLTRFTDWRPTTLYWQRFSIAEKYGKEEIQAVYEEIFKEAKKDYKLLTELVVILKHKTWQHAEDLEYSTFGAVYNELYKTTYSYACDNLEGDYLRYFYHTTK